MTTGSVLGRVAGSRGAHPNDSVADRMSPHPARTAYFFAAAAGAVAVFWKL